MLRVNDFNHLLLRSLPFGCQGLFQIATLSAHPTDCMGVYIVILLELLLEECTV